ncbi:DUF998 domain-containing protein [Kitasatospora sp. GP82]|uniref:DUF998 domain-containing protein n=1 Tax=Kitasatospora sp. GP82 TaxID=3035089 RepID=UPI0024742384|nr:DUF998 domain-containing protein [Kitasatospora sp. GP82]MDH6124615.1 hypothetical protein [Kitasatospora sp. GP82]
MTHTIEAPITTAVPVSTWPTTRALVTGGIVAGPLFLGLGVTQGLTRDGFDFTRNAISQLSLGGLGWIQVTSFLLTGVLVIAGAVGMRRALRDTPGGMWAPRLIGVFGASFLLAAVFTADPGGGFPAGAPDTHAASLSWHGSIHMLSGTVGYLALCAAFLVLARHFAAHQYRGWALSSRLMPLGVLTGFAASSATVLAFTAGAGLGLLWLTAVTARLIKA